jgi:hypothetical protein
MLIGTTSCGETAIGAEESSNRLTTMSQATIDATGLRDLQGEDERKVTFCVPGEPDMGTDTRTISYPGVDSASARRLIREVHSYWQGDASTRSDEEFEVDAYAIDFESPAVLLRVDGFNLSIEYVGGSDQVLRFGASAPCVEHPGGSVAI